MTPPLVSVVLGTYNRLDFLRNAIETIRLEVSTVSHELIVVDGGSSDGTIAWLAAQKDVLTVLQHNRGEWLGEPVPRRSWGFFMNLAFRCARGKYVCMLSDDCLVVPGAIRNGCILFESELAKQHPVGAVAFYWRNWPEQRKYWIGMTLGNRMFVNHGLYLRSALEDAGYIDDTNYRFYHADSDLGLKLSEAGFSCIASPDSYIEHRMDANAEVRESNLERQHEDWDNLLKRWSHLEAPDVDWVYRRFRDPSRTAERYWGPPTPTGRIRRLMRLG